MTQKSSQPPVNLDFLKALSAASSLLRRSAFSEEEVYRIFKDQVRQLNMRGALSVLDPSKKHLTYKAVAYNESFITQIANQFGFAPEGFTFALADVAVYQEVVTKSHSLYVPDGSNTVLQLVPQPMKSVANQIARLLGRNPSIFAPLVVDGEVIGTLNVASKMLTENDVPALVAFANYIAVALNNAKLFQALRQAEALYRRLFTSANDGFVLADPETGLLLSANPSMEKMTGYDQQQLLKMYIFDLHPPEMLAESKRILRYIQQHGQHLFEIPMMSADGRLLFVQVSAAIFEINNKEILLGIVRDITQSKEAEQALQTANLALTTSRDALHRLIQQTPVGILVFNSEGVCLDINQTAMTLLGIADRNHLVGRFRVLYDQLTDHSGIRQAARQALAGELVRLGDIIVDFSALEFPFEKTLGKRILNTTLFPVFDEHGAVANVVTLFQDVTEQKEAELLQSILYRIAALAGSELSLEEMYPRIRQIISELMDAENFYIALYDAETEMLTLPYFVDAKEVYEGPYRAGKGLTEYVIRQGEPLLIDSTEHERLIEQGVLGLVGPPSPIWLGAPLQAQGKPIGAVVVQHYENERAYTERHKQLLNFVSGQIGAAIERKRSEANLQTLATELEQQMQTMDVILSTTPNAFFIYDREGRHLYASPAPLASLGLTLEDVVGKTIEELGSFVPPAFYDELAAVFDTAQSITNDLQQTIQGQIRYFEYTLTPVIDKNGQVLSVVSTSAEVTEQRLAQEAMWHTQRIESLGILAGGVAHDFNNLLVAMLGQNSLALAKLPPESPARSHIQKAMNAAERAAELTRQLLAYSGRGQFELRSINLNSLIEENIHLLELSIPKNVRLNLTLADSLPAIEADSGQMQQIIMNLILNAAEAIGEQQGTIHVGTTVYQLNDKNTEQWQPPGEELPTGSYVLLQVEDDGSGMDEETAVHMFDPFFTTKFTGRGLGLAAVLGIVRGHNGGVHVSSQEGVGTLFKLIFPTVMANSEVAAVPSLTESQPQSGKILVIDDEQPVREAVHDILELDGLVVVGARDGKDGIDVYRKQQDDISLVLLDLSMPGLSGKETFSQLRDVDPQVKIVLSSGYSATEVARQFEGLYVTGFIQKPYDLTHLVTEIRRFLAI